VARGGLIDHDAVHSAIQDGCVGGLGLDVAWVEPVPPEDKLLQHPRVLVTPHIAGVTQLSYRNMADIVVRECLRVHSGQPPSVWLNEAAMRSCTIQGAKADARCRVA
jgi:phosphoglycerate dehydrogenase-like enzyme